MKIGDLSPEAGSNKKVKRIGRGPGSGHGKQSTKGHKGQKARSGSNKGPGFEGGQTPLQRRLPKRGFKNYPFKKHYAIVNLADLAKITDVDIVTPDLLLDRRVIRKAKDGLKVLGVGALSRALTVKAHAFSETARTKISEAGGKAEEI